MKGKTILKPLQLVAAIIFGTVMTVSGILMTVLILYNTLPNVQNVEMVKVIRDGIVSLVNPKYFEAIGYGAIGAFIAVVIAFIVLTWKMPSVFPNMFVIITKWGVFAIICAIAIVIFFFSGTISLETIVINTIGKVGIGVLLGVYIIMRLFGKKIITAAERRIQAYENAMEMKQVGRSSPIWINLLKLFVFMFPEMLTVGILLCSQSIVAPYFAAVLAAIFVVVVGSIWTDANKRREAKRIILRDKINQARAVEALIEDGQKPRESRRERKLRHKRENAEQGE
jgi:hypothetical protein